LASFCDALPVMLFQPFHQSFRS